MIVPPKTTMAAWVPGYWITSDGHALSKRDLLSRRSAQVNNSTTKMHRAAVVTDLIIEGIMQI